MITKELIKGKELLDIRELAEIIQTIALLRSARILRVGETWADLLPLKYQWKTIRVSGWENSQMCKIIILNEYRMN